MESTDKPAFSGLSYLPYCFWESVECACRLFSFRLSTWLIQGYLVLLHADSRIERPHRVSTPTLDFFSSISSRLSLVCHPLLPPRDLSRDITGVRTRLLLRPRVLATSSVTDIVKGLEWLIFDLAGDALIYWPRR